MDIIIKSFNRPFLLDKCLASIQFFAHNFEGDIIVMDDGTPKKYLDLIQLKYPSIKIVKSEFYIQKSEAIANNLEPEKNIPSLFWNEIISKSSEYFILLEDDMWLCEKIDIRKLESDMKTNLLMLVKFLWLNNSKLISSNIIKDTGVLCITNPKLLTKNAFLFDTIYRKKTGKIDVILNRLGLKTEKKLLEYYQIYSVAGAAYSKAYYLKAWETTNNKVDEYAQIQQIIQIPNLKVAHTKSEVVKASYKTTASKQNKESFSSSFDVFSLNKILNEAWFNQDFEPFDFTKDITNAYIKNLILKNQLPEKIFDLWLNWYSVFKENYANIGCEITNDR